MTKFILLLLTVLLGLPAIGSALEAVRFDLRVHQLDVTTNENRLLFADTTTVVKGIQASGFIVAFSTDIDVLEVDSSRVSFQVHVVTLADRPSNASRQFTVEYGLPARLTDIVGKNDVRYTLSLTPLEATDKDTTYCGYTHRSGDDFKYDPSAYVDIYYVPKTLGDFYWNAIKGTVDERYRLFRDINKFNLPGKYLLYVAPCAIPSVIWDDRFGTMVDPVRSTAVTIFNRQINSTDAFAIMHTATFKNYGYAPAFLSEGLAGYLSFARYDMKEIASGGDLLPLDSILDTYAYYRTDPYIADRMASTFVRYLVDQYKISTFIECYKKADDLNLREALESTYDKPVAVLEEEWLTYVDSVTIPLPQFMYYADLAETMQNFALELRYANGFFEHAFTHDDSLRALTYLVRSHYFAGDYYSATEYQQLVTRMDSTSAVQTMQVGTYQMMNGLYDEALVNLTSAYAADSANNLILFNLGLAYLYTDQRVKSADMFARVLANREDGAGQAESRLMLASMLFPEKNEKSEERAVKYCHEAIDMLAPQLASGMAPATAYMWAGIAHLGIGDTQNAWDLLQVAAYLEARPFYLGHINLWLAKVSDVRGEHDVARDYYGRVLGSLSAHYHQKEARVLLNQPFSQ